MQLENYLIKPDVSVLDAMEAIDKGAEGIVYVCDEEKHLLGTITDGDIRRYIIHSGDLNKSADTIMNSRPIKLPLEQRHKAEDCMDQHSISSVPIVDEFNRITELFFLDMSVRSEHRMINSPVVIMAGGKGTRLAPYTQILPKPLIPIGEKTITEHIIERFTEFGCNKFDIIVNYKRHLIKSYFRDVSVSAELTFFDEDEFLGTAGGLKLLSGRYNEPFFMTNCDILVEDDYAKMLDYHKANGNIATIISAIKNTTLPYGVVETTPNGQVSAIKEKPDISTIVNTGFYILNPVFLDLIPQNTFIHITDVIKKCIDNGERVGMYPISGERWLDMGQMDELQIMAERLRERI